MPTLDPTDSLALWSGYQRGLTLEELAERAGLAKSTVHERIQRFNELVPDAGTIQSFRDRRADVMDGLMIKLLARASDPDAINKMTPYQCVGSFGLLYDKMRLETGKSSANISILSKLVDTTQDGADQAIRKSNMFSPNQTDKESGT